MTIYIRTEDLTKWISIENKSEWVSQQLNGLEIDITHDRKNVDEKQTTVITTKKVSKSKDEPFKTFFKK